ncbi:aldo/keto reductase [Allohahella marinimesophila]|uniref:Aldo/keto reductase n=1 Tax=Allohahella marinimesophila TaxID=1054972 RepID=A0ABP7PPE8_9GAMM
MSEPELIDSSETRIATRHVEIPAIGFGTWQLEGSAAERAVTTALEAGYTHIDTAQIYDNEKQVGDAIAKSGLNRSSIFLTTKIWIENFSPSSFQDSLQQSLEKLQTDYVDLLLLHWPNEDADMELTFRELNQVHNEGLTKHIGVSNFTKAWLRDAIAALDAPVVNNQIECHPFLDQSVMVKECRASDVVVTAYSPLARGKVFENETINAIAKKHGKSAVQVSLRWLNQNGIVAIPKGSSEEHIKANLDIFDFRLEEEDMAAINRLGSRGGRLIDPDFAPEWD